MLPLALVYAIAAVAAGCGGSKTPPVASLTTTAATSASHGVPAAKPSRVAFAACLTQHGFEASPGSSGSAPSSALDVFGVIVSGKVDPQSPQFEAAMAACRKYLPGGGPPAMTPAAQAEWMQGMTKFAGCMRANGVPGFPDPTGAGRFPPGGLAGIDPNSSLVEKAFKACEPLEPNVGPRIDIG